MNKYSLNVGRKMEVVELMCLKERGTHPVGGGHFLEESDLELVLKDG